MSKKSLPDEPLPWNEFWRNRITPEDLIYYTRLIFGLIGAAIASAFNLSGLLGLVGFFVGIVLVVVSYLIPIYILGVDPQEIGGHGKGLMKGLGTGALIFLVVWFLAFNFIYYYSAITP
ncbi:MAG: hypothetical protein ACFFDU_10805 [Candidatus Thorarchaeota archaeon]